MTILLFDRLAIFSRTTLVLTASLLFVCLFSCRKQEIEIPTTSVKQAEPDLSTAFTQVLSSSKLLYEETFEGKGPFFYNAQIQSATTYGFTASSNTFYQGKMCGRFELRDTDPSASGGTRAEVKYPPLTNANQWYSYAVFFPSYNYRYDSEAEIISQWHQGGGVSPSVSLITRYDKLYLEIRSVPKIRQQFLLGNLVKDKWQRYVFHIVHSPGSTGLVEVWRNGVKIFTRKGANAYSFSSYDKPSFKVGLYKWEWNGTKTTDTRKRVIFFDNVRVGSQYATYSDMVLSAFRSITPLAQIKSFVLVNAETEKGIMNITSGSIIDISKIAAKKLNIRAIPNLSVGSVAFVLSGRQNKAYKDNDSPYALNGDDGHGNYYSGSWDPPPVGSYTLEATPYSEDKASGLVGVTKKITFKVVE
jgi:hypothetical protein